jgi:cation transport ATPase
VNALPPQPHIASNPSDADADANANANATGMSHDGTTHLAELLARPTQQRLLEFKYRFGQSVVFGLPVLFLQQYGAALGPADHERWVSLLQALLAGWVLYVNLGMLAEGGLMFRQRGVTADFVVAAAAALLYVYSLISAVHGIVTARLLYRPLLFGAMAALLMVWDGVRGFQLSRRQPRA